MTQIIGDGLQVIGVKARLVKQNAILCRLRDTLDGSVRCQEELEGVRINNVSVDDSSSRDIPVLSIAKIDKKKDRSGLDFFKSGDKKTHVNSFCVGKKRA